MRLSAVLVMVLSLVVLLACCAPTMRQILIDETASYTQCDYVAVDCVDDDCSNVQGGPWNATACGTPYRCTHTAGQVTCVPQTS